MFNKHFVNLGVDVSKFDFSNFPFMKSLLGNLEECEYCVVMLRYDGWEGRVKTVRKMQLN